VLRQFLAIAATFAGLTAPVSAEEIGSVDTAFKLLGSNHRVVVEAFDDPDISGVSCFVSRARTGGLSGTLGLAEDTSDASIACRQTGPIEISGDLEEGQEVFGRRSSILFKRLQVVRFFDEVRNTLIYLSYSDRLIDGSPKNSVSAVVIRPWQDAAGG